MLVAPDGRSFLALENGGRVVRSLQENTAKPIPGLQAADFPIAWASDSRHIFTQVETATGLTIYKMDLESGRRELWQTATPNDQVGLRPVSSPTAITPDGRWIAFSYETRLGQLYSSDTLK